MTPHDIRSAARKAGKRRPTRIAEDIQLAIATLIVFGTMGAAIHLVCLAMGVD